MNSQSNDNSQSDVGSKRSGISQNKSSLISKEKIYSQIKDSHQNINVEVPDLFPTEDDKLNGYDDQSDENDIQVSNKNSQTLSSQHKKSSNSEYKGAPSGNARNSQSKTPQKPINNSEYRFTPKINQASHSIDRNIDDLYKWKDRRNKNIEVKRDFLQQVKDSNYNYKVYTNNQSNNIVENSRPKGRVEEILLAKGKEKQNRLKQKEIEIYGKAQRPVITKKAQSLNRNVDIYSRLYDVDKDRREKGKEQRTLSEHQRSISAERKKLNRSKETSPDARNVINKKPVTNLKIQTVPTHGESSSTPVSGRVYEQILKEAYSNRSNKTLNTLSSPPNRSLKSSDGFDSKKNLDPTPKSSTSSEKVNLYKKLTKPFPSSDNGKLLSNMLYFKQNDGKKRDNASISKLPTDFTQVTRTDTRDSNSMNKNKRPTEGNSIRNYEAFWDQLLKDDQRDTVPHFDLNINNIGDRHKVWMDIKNKKVDNKKKMLETREMSECTFQPVFYSKMSQELQKNHENLYQKFLERMTAGANVNTTLNRGSPQTAREEPRILTSPKSPQMFSSPNSKALTTKHSDYSADMQSRLYNYILDSEKKS